MKPSTLQYLWSLVEQMPTRLLLELDDHSLLDCLLKQLRFQPVLEPEEIDAAQHYLRARLRLIRDVADARPHANNRYCCSVQRWTSPALA